jgi:hypothetical protein
VRSPHFERDKFRELLVYIAERSADDPYFGDTKVNKALYWIDFFGYSHIGHPVTGAKYTKQPRGPLASPLLPVRQELVAEGALRVEERRVGDFSARVTAALRRANTALFSKEELELADSIIDQLKGRWAVTVSAVSHKQSPGWNLVEMGEEIPYSTALISTDPVSDQTEERLRETAARLGW